MTSQVLRKGISQKLGSKEHALVVVPLDEVQLDESTRLSTAAVQFVPLGSKAITLSATDQNAQLLVMELFLAQKVKL